MGHESQIELWSPTGPRFCFAGFGTDRLRCEEAMKTGLLQEKPKSLEPNESGNRAAGADGQNRSHSIKWAGKQENIRPREEYFS